MEEIETIIKEINRVCDLSQKTAKEHEIKTDLAILGLRLQKLHDMNSDLEIPDEIWSMIRKDLRLSLLMFSMGMLIIGAES